MADGTWTLELTAAAAGVRRLDSGVPAAISAARGRWITTNFTAQTHTIPKSRTFSIKALRYADSNRLRQTLCRWVSKTRSSSPDDTDPHPRRIAGVFIHTTVQSRISRRDVLEP